MILSVRAVARRCSLAAICAAALAVSGCEATREILTPEVQTHGNRIRPDVLGQIEAGRQNRNDILNLLGTPSSRSAFGPEVWYYVSRTTQPLLFLRPQTLDQRVVAIAFDEGGRVSEVRQLTLADRQEVDFVQRETPTRGSELTMIQQIIGNLGRFEDSP
ncbi:MAG: outer membrane protein assembly factor BamE [Acetobacterales bacterium]